MMKQLVHGANESCGHDAEVISPQEQSLLLTGRELAAQHSREQLKMLRGDAFVARRINAEQIAVEIGGQPVEYLERQCTIGQAT
jgi:hypothetical protein